MWTWMKRLGRDEEGAAALTYVLTILMVAVAMVPGLSLLQEKTSEKLNASPEKVKLAAATMARGQSARGSGRLIVVTGDKSKPYERSVTRR